MRHINIDMATHKVRYGRLFRRRVDALVSGLPGGSRPRRRACTLAIIWSIVATAGLQSAPARTQPLDDAMWVTNGTVYAIARDGDRLYIGGGFDRVGPPTGPAAVVNSTTGEAIPTSFRFMGSVRAAIPDGAGGWFVGGSFAGGGDVPLSTLAHVLPDGSVAAWTPHPDGMVTALAMAGDIVYVGGQFTTIDGQPRARLAAIDASSGHVTAWNPGADGQVLALASAGGVIYAGGTFAHVGGAARSLLAAIDGATGAVSSWSPMIAGASVRCLEVAGDAVYVGGEFGVAGATSGANLAAFDRATAARRLAVPFADRAVLALRASGGTVFIGGDFLNVAGLPRSRLAALAATSGTLLSWSPGTDGSVWSLASDGSTVYVAGWFESAGTQGRWGLAAADATTGAIRPWDPRANATRGRCVAVGGDRVLVGGDFTSVGSVARSGLAAIDLVTGAATSWDPGPRSASDYDPPTIEGLAISAGVVFVAGYYDSIGGEARRYLTAIDAATGAPTAWNPDPDQPVDFLALHGGALYAAGWFNRIGGAPRQRLAALDLASASALPWNPGVNGSITGVVFTDARVYACGNFSTIGGAARTGLAALDPVTGLALAWNPSPDGPVSALASSRGYLVAGGSFQSIGGRVRAHLAQLDLETGAATAWVCDADYSVSHLAVMNGALYVGGVFGALGGQPRFLLGSVDETTGATTSWAPAMQVGLGEDPVQCLVAAGDRVFLGGYFVGVNLLPHSFLVAFHEDVSTPVLVSLLGAAVRSDRVELSWQVDRARSGDVLQQRCEVGGPWRTIGTCTPDAADRVRFIDRDVAPGKGYGYRVAFTFRGRPVVSEERWVVVPADVALAVGEAQPNPSRGALAITVTLPSSAPASLELLDPAGRRVRSIAVAARAGRQTVVVAAPETPPGLYWVRVRQGAQVATSRITIVK